MTTTTVRPDPLGYFLTEEQARKFHEFKRYTENNPDEFRCSLGSNAVVIAAIRTLEWIHELGGPLTQDESLILDEDLYDMKVREKSYNSVVILFVPRLPEQH